MKVKLTRWNNGQPEAITVNIDEQGNITALVEGVAGPTCTEISQFLDELGQVTLDQNTPDFYQQVVDTAYQTGGY